MPIGWKQQVLLGLLAAATWAAEPPGADLETTPAEKAPMLTLGTPGLRTAMERLRLPWLYPEGAPDFRVKLERPAAMPGSVSDLEGQLRGLEIRLPLTGFSVGNETQGANEEPQATFSIQRSF